MGSCQMLLFKNGKVTYYNIHFPPNVRKLLIFLDDIEQAILPIAALSVEVAEARKKHS